MSIDKNYQGVYRPLEKSDSGQQIKLLTLKTLLEAYQIRSAVLKMDCEGCEYDVILNTPNNILKKFAKMQIEYHYGSSSLKKKLEDPGITVSVTKPRYRFNKFADKKVMHVGWLYAEYLK